MNTQPMFEIQAWIYICENSNYWFHMHVHIYWIRFLIFELESQHVASML